MIDYYWLCWLLCVFVCFWILTNAEWYSDSFGLDGLSVNVLTRTDFWMAWLKCQCIRHHYIYFECFLSVNGAILKCEAFQILKRITWKWFNLVKLLWWPNAFIAYNHFSFLSQNGFLFIFFYQQSMNTIEFSFIFHSNFFEQIDKSEN